MSIQENITKAFIDRYGEAPAVLVRAPGRVNLIGEHTDYNDGFVFPLAIDRAIWIALRPRQDRQVNIYSLNFDQVFTFDLDHMSKDSKGAPDEYMKGVAWALAEAGHTLSGFEGVMMGDVPIGASLSSSAALEMAIAQSFAAVSGFAFEPPKMALLGQKAENKWVGVNTGIMDQMISAAGEDGHALLIDCRSLETSAVPLPPGSSVVVLDSGTRRGLVGGEYDIRRAQCEQAAEYFGVKALRDVDMATFEAKADGLDPVVRRRAQHVITENDRTLQARDAMLAEDAVLLGHLMDMSHESLCRDYEVCGPAVDVMVQIARKHEACYGARMTGGGFGGCAVALVREEQAQAFAEFVMSQYDEESQEPPAAYVCRASQGASIVS